MTTFFVLAATVGLIGIGSAVVRAQEADEAFDRLSENVQKVVIAVNEEIGGLDGVCDTDQEERTQQINRTVAALTESDAFSGTGFFALDAGNYYDIACRDR